MSYSKQDRLDNMDLALKRFMDELGEQRFTHFFINDHDNSYEDIYETTWIELQHHFLIRKGPLTGYFVFTPDGWRRALDLTSANNDAMREKIGQICRVLKTEVDGRKNPNGMGIITLEEVSTRTGLQPDFVSNVIEGQLIEYWLDRHGASWVDAMPGQLISVPLNFGQTRLL